MNDTVTRLMEMIDEHAHNASEATRLDYETWHLKSKVKQAFADVQTSRQAIEAELVRLFTFMGEAAVWHEGSNSYYQAKLIRKISPEEAHGIGGES